MELFHHLKKKIPLLLAACLICAVATFAVTTLLIPQKYTAVTRVYVLNRSEDTAVVSADFSLSDYMINDYKVLITGRNVTKEVISQLNLDMTHRELSKMIQVSAPDNTRVLQISVTDTEAQRAAEIANGVRDVAVAQIKAIMDVDAVNLIYEAQVPTSPSAPNVMRNTALVAAVGLILAIVVFTVIFILDDTIRTEEDVEKYLGLVTMGANPVSSEQVSGGSSAGRQNAPKAKPAAQKK